MQGGSAWHLEPSGLAGDVGVGSQRVLMGPAVGEQGGLATKIGRGQGRWPSQTRQRMGRNSEGPTASGSPRGEPKSAGQAPPTPRLGGQRIDCEFITCRMSATDTSWMLSHHQANRSPERAGGATVQLVQRAAGWSSEPVALPAGSQWASQNPEPSFRGEPRARSVTGEPERLRTRGFRALLRVKV